MCIMHQRAWYVHRCIKFNIENPISMGSDDERCIFIDVQRKVHVYQISDENDFIKILSARRGHLCKHWILSECFEKQSLVFVF